jgi:hypothetical protein
MSFVKLRDAMSSGHANRDTDMSSYPFREMDIDPATLVNKSFAFTTLLNIN